MSNITPMKKLRTHFDSFKELTEGSYRYFILNKSSPKFNPYGGDYGYGGSSKGVNSDFILIFQDLSNYKTRQKWDNGNLVKKTSFSFLFDYINSEKETVIFQLKADAQKSNKEIVSSKPMSIDEFKDKMRTINKSIKLLTDKNQITIMNELVNSFLEIPMNLKNEIESEQLKINTFIDKKEIEIEKDNLEVKVLEKDLKISSSKFQNSLSRTKAYKDLKIANEAMKAAKNIYEAKKDQLSIKYQIKEKKEHLSTLKEIGVKNNKQMKEEIKQIKRKNPSIISSKLRP
jgi:hypothetical protein